MTVYRSIQVAPTLEVVNPTCSNFLKACITFGIAMLIIAGESKANCRTIGEQFLRNQYGISADYVFNAKEIASFNNEKICLIDISRSSAFQEKFAECRERQLKRIESAAYIYNLDHQASKIIYDGELIESIFVTFKYLVHARDELIELVAIGFSPSKMNELANDAYQLRMSLLGLSCKANQFDTKTARSVDETVNCRIEDQEKLKVLFSFFYPSSDLTGCERASQLGDIEFQSLMQQYVSPDFR